MLHRKRVGCTPPTNVPLSSARSSSSSVFLANADNGSSLSSSVPIGHDAVEKQQNTDASQQLQRNKATAQASSSSFAPHRFQHDSAAHDFYLKGSIHQKSSLWAFSHGPRVHGPTRGIRGNSQIVTQAFGNLRDKRAVLFSSPEVRSVVNDNTPRLSWTIILPQFTSLPKTLLRGPVCEALLSLTAEASDCNVVLGSSFMKSDQENLVAAQGIFLTQLYSQIPMLEESLVTMDAPKDVHLVSLLTAFRAIGVRPPSLEGASVKEIRAAMLLQETLLMLEKSVAEIVDAAFGSSEAAEVKKRDDSTTTTDVVTVSEAAGAFETKLSRRELAQFDKNMEALVGALRWFGDDWVEQVMGFRMASLADTTTTSSESSKTAMFPCLSRITRCLVAGPTSVHQ